MDKSTITKSLTIVSAVLLVAAYGSSNATSTSAAGIAGIYFGSTTSYRYPGPTASTPRRLFGAVASDGTGYFVSVPTADGSIRLFRNLRAKGRITSAEYEVTTEGQAAARGPQNWKIEIQPAGGGLYDIHGKFNNVSGYVGFDLQMQPLTHREVSLDDESGTYRGIDSNRETKGVITLAADGRITGTDGGCRISGTLTQVGSLDLFDARVMFSGPPACHEAMTGIAFFDTRDLSGRFSKAQGSYLYLIGTNGDFSHGFAMALSRQRK